MNPNRRGSHERDIIDDGDRGAREWPSVLAQGWNTYLRRSFHEVLLTSKMNVLLLLIPLAFISKVDSTQNTNDSFISIAFCLSDV
jgi:hypothetical protein